MTTEISEQKPVKAVHHSGVPPPEPEHLPCPRCNSTNTKFCYYNNYNFSQPRHFCKGCRRYWTKGGTLRDIPVGGGTRKSAKRCRTSTVVQAPVQSSAQPTVFSLSNEAYSGTPQCAGFTSLLGTYGPGFSGLSGIGLGVGSGFEDLGFGLRRPVWPFGDGGATTGNTWQLQSGENGFMSAGAGGGECFTLPELAISTPGYCLK